jgi:hypothetical protein
MADLPNFVKMGIVVALFLTEVMLLGSLNDKWVARRNATELANPGHPTSPLAAAIAPASSNSVGA